MHFFLSACLPCQVGVYTLIPMYSDALQKHIACGQPRNISGLYFAIFFMSGVNMLMFGLMAVTMKVFSDGFQLRCTVPHRCRFLCGMMNTLNSFLLIYSSPPDRTPVSIQPLLTAAVIPFTVGARYLLLHKGINTPRVICTLATIIGLLISMEPVLFKMHKDGDGRFTAGKEQWAWSLIFLSAMAPVAIMNVLEEGAFRDEGGKRTDVGSVMFLFWTYSWTFIMQAALFFTDFIPWFGQSNNFSDFSMSMHNGFNCMFGSAPAPYSYTNCTAQFWNSSQATAETFNPDPHCDTPIVRFWIMTGFFCCTSVTLMLLVKYSDGAIYAVLVSSLNAPMGAIFWMLFHLDRFSHFSWKPTFDTSRVYVFVGLLIIVPAVGLYNFIGIVDEEKSMKAKKRGKHDRVSENNLIQMEDNTVHQMP